jgi:hypothetical protein
MGVPRDRGLRIGPVRAAPPARGGTAWRAALWVAFFACSPCAWGRPWRSRSGPAPLRMGVPPRRLCSRSWTCPTPRAAVGVTRAPGRVHGGSGTAPHYKRGYHGGVAGGPGVPGLFPLHAGVPRRACEDWSISAPAPLPGGTAVTRRTSSAGSSCSLYARGNAVNMALGEIMDHCFPVHVRVPRWPSTRPSASFTAPPVSGGITMPGSWFQVWCNRSCTHGGTTSTFPVFPVTENRPPPLPVRTGVPRGRRPWPGGPIPAPRTQGVPPCAARASLPCSTAPRRHGGITWPRRARVHGGCSPWATGGMR